MSTKPSGLEGLDHLPSNTPIFMLNLVKFRETTQYEDPHSDFAKLPTIPGADGYFNRYLPAFRAVAAKVGTKAGPQFVGDALVNVITDGKEDWDLVLIIRYESKEAFSNVARSKEYHEQAGPHRIAAVKEWKLIASVERDYTVPQA